MRTYVQGGQKLQELSKKSPRGTSALVLTAASVCYQRINFLTSISLSEVSGSEFAVQN